ncbi:MAG: TetR/AcrR family transcriptional regulator [Desulforhopalus sp.]
MQRQKTQDRQEAILSVALKLFTERGYFNTSVHDIQKQAQVSIGSIYHHFENKEAIAKALFVHIEESMNMVIGRIMKDHSTAHDRCKAVISYFFDTAEQNPEAMQYMLYAKHQEFMPDEKPVCSSRPFTLMKEMVICGMENGEIRTMDPNVAAVLIFGGAIRLIFLRMDGALENVLSSYLHECWEGAWRGVKH